VEDLLLYFLSPFCVEKENLIVDRSDSANYWIKFFSLQGNALGFHSFFIQDLDTDPTLYNRWFMYFYYCKNNISTPLNF
jgi:hypothetical protein